MAVPPPPHRHLHRARARALDRLGREAYLLDRSYVDAIQAAGGLALMLPPDPQAEGEPDEVLDLLDGLILAGGADIDPATYGEAAHAATAGTRPERDALRGRAGAPRARARHPAAGHLPRHAAA